MEEMNGEQLSLFGSGSVVDEKHSEQYENDDRDNEYYGIFYGDNLTVKCRECWKHGRKECDLPNLDPDSLCAMGRVKPSNLEHYEPEIAKVVGYWYHGMLNKYAMRKDGSFGFCCCDSSDERIGKTNAIECKDCQFNYDPAKGNTNSCDKNKWRWQRADYEAKKL